MGFQYIRNKGLGVHGHVEKSGNEWTLNQIQVSKILNAAEESKTKFNANWLRDYTFIFLGYFLGLRIGEACLLTRHTFEDMMDLDCFHIPTLKNIERIPHQCTECKKKFRVRQNRIGEDFTCSKCQAKSPVIAPDRKLSQEIPEKDLPFVEDQTQQMILEYIESMRPDQEFLFESKPGRHISRSYAARIFSTFAVAAGLSPKYSFHALRHGRGMFVYSTQKDLLSVAKSLRHKTLAMAQRYADLDPEMKKEAKKKLEKRSTITRIQLDKPVPVKKK